jgi:uncharacterized protein (DUF1697 family)
MEPGHSLDWIVDFLSPNNQNSAHKKQMTTFISLLRGINVSGHRMIRMEALIGAVVDLGFRNVRTYIQSGNLIFESNSIDTKEISGGISRKIHEDFGFDVPVITITAKELERVIASNPFSKNSAMDSAFLHVVFLSEEPDIPCIDKLHEIDFRRDELALIGKALYIYCPDGYSNSRLTNGFLEARLKVAATTRNWKTTNELFRIASGK